MRIRKHTYTNLYLTIIAIMGATILDLSLQLGKLHGVMATIILLYAASAFLIVNAIIGFISMIRKGQSKYHFFDAAVFGAGLALSAWLARELMHWTIT